MDKIVIGKGDALIVIDAQNDFIYQTGKLYVAGVPGESDNETIFPNILALDRKPFGYRTASLDKHPLDHVEFAIFGEHCLWGDKGSEVVFPLRSLTGLFWEDNLLIKGRHPALISYSVAMSPDFGAHIADLRKTEIKRVFLCGWAYTHCVGESAIAYACQGFEVYVIRDLTRSVPPPYGDPELMDLKLNAYKVKVINLADIDLAA